MKILLSIIPLGCWIQEFNRRKTFRMDLNILNHECMKLLGIQPLQSKNKGWRWLDKQFSNGGARILVEDATNGAVRFLEVSQIRICTTTTNLSTSLYNNSSPSPSQNNNSLLLQELMGEKGSPSPWLTPVKCDFRSPASFISLPFIINLELDELNISGLDGRSPAQFPHSRTDPVPVNFGGAGSDGMHADGS